MVIFFCQFFVPIKLCSLCQSHWHDSLGIKWHSGTAEHHGAATFVGVGGMGVLIWVARIVCFSYFLLLFQEMIHNHFNTSERIYLQHQLFFPRLCQNGGKSIKKCETWWSSKWIGLNICQISPFLLSPTAQWNMMAKMVLLIPFVSEFSLHIAFILHFRSCNIIYNETSEKYWRSSTFSLPCRICDVKMKHNLLSHITSHDSFWGKAGWIFSHNILNIDYLWGFLRCHENVRVTFATTEIHSRTFFDVKHSDFYCSEPHKHPVKIRWLPSEQLLSFNFNQLCGSRVTIAAWIWLILF